MSTHSPNALNTDTVRLKITIGDATFIAKMHNNSTAAAFQKALPMTLHMADLNGNEKYFNLPNEVALNASMPESIQAGDLMLFGSNTLVLFYKSFSTSYHYSPIARVDDPARLADALGDGNSTVKFEFK